MTSCMIPGHVELIDGPGAVELIVIEHILN
jgi:hypothetical protein